MAVSGSPQKSWTTTRAWCRPAAWRSSVVVRVRGIARVLGRLQDDHRGAVRRLLKDLADALHRDHRRACPGPSTPRFGSPHHLQLGHSGVEDDDDGDPAEDDGSAERVFFRITRATSGLGGSPRTSRSSRCVRRCGWCRPFVFHFVVDGDAARNRITLCFAQKGSARPKARMSPWSATRAAGRRRCASVLASRSR